MSARTCLAILIGGILAAGPYATAANADTNFDVSDPVAMMTALAPDHVTDASEDVSVTTPAADTQSSRLPGGPAILKVPKNSADIAAPDFYDTTTRVTFPDQSVFTKQVGDYAVYQKTGKASYVKGTPDGAQIIFTAKSRSDVQFSVSFSSAISDSQVVDSGVRLIDFADSSEIALYPAWARDANGRDLPTSYVISSTAIAQVVTTTPTTKFPILADPAWSYTKVHSVGKTTASAANKTLHSCFNCKFPIQGAPHDFPTPGTDLPLYIGFKYGKVNLSLNFDCTFDEEFSNYDQGGSYWGYMFDATKNHVDGPGSNISFTFRSNTTKNSLAIYGYVKKTHPAHLPQGVYVTGADIAWSNFATNMKT